jgi:beta-galactosidase GanA
MDEKRFCQLRRRLKAGRVIRWFEWRGCSPGEIAALERRYGVRLPATYRAFLQAMGHGAGKLFRHDHLAVTLNYVLDMTGHVRARMAAQNAVDPLPGDALVILGRLDSYFQFIRCAHENDSSVWELNEVSWQVEPIHDSLFDWLEYWCEEAEAAILQGYFKGTPWGTRP